MSQYRRIGIVNQPGQIELQQVEMEPVPETNALVRIDMNGICGTDVHYFYDPEIVTQRAPLTLGHEWVGTIMEMGARFPRVDMFGEPIAEGDRIVALYYMCGQCYYCRVLHQPSLCIGGAEMRPYKLPRLQGGIGDYMQIPFTSAVVKIPSDMPNETATLADPFAVAIGGVERAFGSGEGNQRWGMGLGKTVLVQGAGPIGIFTVIAARLAGAAKIVVIGAPKKRLELCQEFGADEVIDFQETSREERREQVLDMTPHHLGPDVVIETAGVPAAFEEGIDLVRRGGTYVEVGHFSHRGMATVDPYVLCMKHIHLYGSWVYTYGNWAETASVMRVTYKTIPYSHLVTHHFRLEQA
ncbi:MAG: zinc-binding dehydrogenase, partial [Chloroflexi bacterium]|nr:zinc-binding dehydrogenase [Chloroflexota bacterium]